jgi:hypothetical protein
MSSTAKWKRSPVSFVTCFVLLLLASNILTPFGPHTVHASLTGNIVTNGSFEEGLTGWRVPSPNFACEGVADANVTVDATRWVDGGQSAKIFTGPVTPTGCSQGDFSGRTGGFTQFPQVLPAGLTFNNLTDSPNALSFWFYLEPYGNTMAGFDLRVFGGEQIAELDYVLDADLSLYPTGYANHTDPNTGRDGYRSIILNGYQPGQWYHFSRNLKADWGYPTPGLGGLNMSWSFSLIQFEGLAISNQGAVESETLWLDDVRVYTGPDPPPVETHYTLFNFTDHSGNIVDSKIKWKLLNSSRQEVSYTLGQNDLSPGPYYLDAYYLVVATVDRILDAQIHLDTTLNIQLAMFPQTTVPGGYVILDKPVGSLIILQEDNRRLGFNVQGTAGTTYELVADTPTKPGLVQMNGNDLAENLNWNYNTFSSLLTLTYQSSGSDSFSIIFGQPPVSSFTINVTSTTALAEVSLDASSSSDPGGTIAGYLWSFGDGQSGTGVTVHHTYAVGGSYTITLNVTESAGASRASSKTIHLTPNTLPSISFIDKPGYPLSSMITFKILDPAGNEVQYTTGRTVPYGVYTLEAFYKSYQVYNAPLSFTNQQPIQLQFSPLDTSRTTYVAVNSTTSEINIAQNDNSQITFTLSGTGPYLIVVDVPSRPFFVEKDGSRIADWVYNSTSQTIAIQTDSQGSFLVSLVEPPSFPYLYLGIGILGVIAAAVLTLVLVRRARKVPSS